MKFTLIGDADEFYYASADGRAQVFPHPDAGWELQVDGADVTAVYQTAEAAMGAYRSPAFSVGEYVTRSIDRKFGQVKKVQWHNGTWIFYVFFDDADKTEDNPDGWWGGLAQAWKRQNLHAHVDTGSRDCDGTYSGGHVEQMTLEERCDSMGDLHFKDRVLAGVVSLHGTGRLKVTPEGLEWFEQTDEGYRAADVRWCEDDCEEASWQRDHRAEEMGY